MSVRKADTLDMFTGFKVGSFWLFLTLLQYVDDILFIEKIEVVGGEPLCH